MTARQPLPAPAPPAPVLAEPPRRLPLAARAGRFLRALGGLFPFTLAGLALLTLTGAAFWYLGRGRMDLVILTAALVGAVVAAAALLLVVLAALLTAVKMRRASLRPSLEIEAEIWQPSGFEVGLPRWLPGVEVIWEWEDPPCQVRQVRQKGRWIEMVRPPRRGLYHQVRRRITVRDSLSLCALTWWRTQPAAVRILPRRAPLDHLALLARVVTGEDLSDPRGDPMGDRVDMRQYTRGDPPRMILWKVYARTRKLMVRVPERAITARPRVCAYLVAGAGDEAAASVLRVLVEQELLGLGWRFGADGSDHYAGTPQEALEILARSGQAPTGEPSAGGLARFLAQAEHDGYSTCLVFPPPAEGRWIEAVRGAMRQTRLHTCAVLGIDHLVFQKPSSRAAWLKYLVVPPPDEGHDLQEVTRLMGRWGPGTVVVERRTGKVYTDLHAFAERR
jgi:hypothetical protein